MSKLELVEPYIDYLIQFDKHYPYIFNVDMEVEKFNIKVEDMINSLECSYIYKSNIKICSNTSYIYDIREILLYFWDDDIEDNIKKILFKIL